MRYAVLLLLPCFGWAQNTPLKLNPAVREMPAYIQERLDPKDRALFGKLMRFVITGRCRIGPVPEHG